MSNVAVFVALAEELEYAAEIMGGYGEFSESLSEIEHGRTQFNFTPNNTLGGDLQGLHLSGLIEVHLIKGMGNILAAANVGTSFNRKSRIDPVFAVLVGISGSPDVTKAALGDVVISNHVKYYSPDKIVQLNGHHVVLTSALREQALRDGLPSCLALEPGQIAIDDRDIVLGDNGVRFLRENLRHVDQESTGNLFVREMAKSKSAKTFSIRTGALLGSNWVIDSDSYTKYLRDKNSCQQFDYYSLNGGVEGRERNSWNNEDPVCVDMESYGFFKAVSQFSKQRARVNAYAVRGISDLCAGKGDFDKSMKNTNRKAAAENAVNSALSLFAFYLRQSNYSHNVK